MRLFEKLRASWARYNSHLQAAVGNVELTPLESESFLLSYYAGALHMYQILAHSKLKLSTIRRYESRFQQALVEHGRSEREKRLAAQEISKPSLSDHIQ